MSNPASAPVRVLNEEILALWEERSIREVHSARTAASRALRDSLPLYLNHLFEALATNRKMDFKSVFAHDQEGIRIGRMHGADRASNRSYMLTKVIFEYHILREVIFQVLERHAPLTVTRRDIILDSIEQAVNDAAVKFSEVHADVQEKFINTLTHDLKTPITAAKLNAQILAKRPGLSSEGSVNANRVASNLNRLDSMIHDLLDVSKVRAGEPLSLQFVSCDLSQIVREVAAEMSVVHSEKIIVHGDPAILGCWSQDGLRRSIENLVGNAIKYGAANTAIEISSLNRETYAEVTVLNQGQPIPVEDLEFLFDPFRRSKTAHEGTKRGWGLGLTLVRGVVEAHNGKIKVKSESGLGTSFILEIPFQTAVAG